MTVLPSNRYFILFLLFAATNAISVSVVAQEEAEPQRVVIERAAITFKDPEKYAQSFQLQPVNTMPVIAPVDAIVKRVLIEPGESVVAQGELIRLDSHEFNLELKRAQAVLEKAKLQFEMTKNADAKKLAQADLDIATSELDLAKFRVDRTILVSALDGIVSKVNVIEGQFVRAGDVLASIISPTQLYVDLPIERADAKAGDAMSIKVEATEAEGKIQAVLPALAEFDPLRELFLSVATAKVIVDSQGGNLKSGQTVYSNMVPRHPVAEIQAIALKTDTENPDSERMVQVIRDGFVRSIPVQLLGQVGQTHLFISGRFSPNDELIVSSSEPLADGAWVRPMLLTDEEEPQQNAGRTGPRTSPGF